MKLSKLLQIRKILGIHSQEKVPTILAYKIMKFIKASEQEGAFYNEKFRKIIEKYSEKDEKGNPVLDGNNIKLNQETAEECTKAVYELENTEVEVPNVSFTINELEPLAFSVSEMFILDDLIKEE